MWPGSSTTGVGAHLCIFLGGAGSSSSTNGVGVCLWVWVLGVGALFVSGTPNVSGSGYIDQPTYLSFF